MRVIERSSLLLSLSLAFSVPVVGAARGPAHADAPIPTAAAVEPPNYAAHQPTETQERMTLPELRAYFDTLDPGVPVRLVRGDGSQYVGTYSGGDSTRAIIYCRKGLAAPQPVSLEDVTDTFVFVDADHFVRIHRLR